MRLHIALGLFLIAELWFCIQWFKAPRDTIVPPLPDMSGYNSYTTERLSELFRNCDLDSPADWMNLSDAYIAHGFYPEAEACARTACQLAPEDPDLLYRWAFCQAAMGRIADAIASYKRSLELGFAEPQSIWYLIGREYLRAEQADLARSALEKAEPQVAAVYEIAKLDARGGSPKAALPRIEEIEEKYPNAYAPALLRSQVEQMLGNKQSAGDYRLISTLNRGKLPSPIDAFRERYLNQLRDFSISSFVELHRDAVENGNASNVKPLIEAVAQAGYEPQLEDLLANVDFALGDRNSQQRRLESIIEKDGASTYRCWRLAKAYAADGRIDEAIEELKTGLRLDQREMVAESREDLIALYEQQGELGKARFHASRLVFWQGMQALQEAKIPAAHEQLNLAVQMDPQQADAWYYLGLVEGLLGNSDLQGQAYRRCLEINPQHGRSKTWVENLPDGPDSQL